MPGAIACLAIRPASDAQRRVAQRRSIIVRHVRLCRFRRREASWPRARDAPDVTVRSGFGVERVTDRGPRILASSLRWTVRCRKRRKGPVARRTGQHVGRRHDRTRQAPRYLRSPALCPHNFARQRDACLRSFDSRSKSPAERRPAARRAYSKPSPMHDRCDPVPATCMRA